MALSSAEAEYNALIKASCETLGLKRLAEELGLGKHSGIVFTDSSAAYGTIHRRGAGRLKHLQTQKFWLQEQAERGELSFKKIGRAFNNADLLTHHWAASSGSHVLERMGMKRADM